MTLLQLLKDYSRSEALPMHMPGHKRNTDLAPYLRTLSADLDITEIDGFGNLHDTEGLLTERMKAAADLWGSKRAWWLIGGSTAGLLAAVDAATQIGDKVLIARNCHKSVYHACMLCRLETAYIQPTLFPNHSFADRITPEQVEAALNRQPGTRLVIITSPTYEGLCSDISEISRIVHRYGAILLVDEAHGAHLGLHPHFPASAVTQGADIVVQSLHKTLPSLTQTALLHLCSERVSAEELGFRLSVYQTSSPSYLLMASIDSCIQLLTEQRHSLFENWRNNLSAYDAALTVTHLHAPLRSIPYADPSKLLISTAGTSITGPVLAELLRSQYHIEAEMSTADTVLCMTGMGDTPENLLRVANALNEIDQTLSHSQLRPIPPLPLPQADCSISAAVSAAKSESISVPLSNAADRTAADFLWAYPPGIPLVVPGERITKELIAYIDHAERAGVAIHGAKSAAKGMVRILKST